MTIQHLTETGGPLPGPSIESHSGFSVARVSVGISRIILPTNARTTREDCVRTCAELLALTGGKPGGALLQITGVGSFSPDVISVFGQAATLTAFAVLGKTPADRVIAHRLLRPGPPRCPAKYFTDEETAISWLRTIGSSDHRRMPDLTSAAPRTAAARVTSRTVDRVESGRGTTDAP
ncbi:hypothetical protein [Paenarthrobacter sp. NEAU-H11]|uniref:DUF7793 family protein n=1 Tax=Paenarthrobacter sp. NEAU-H11 TaxID=3423924 RepID=UPI003D34BD97